MTKQELIKQLREVAKESDAEKAHENAETLLLEYIDNLEITLAFLNIKRWYA